MVSTSLVLLAADVTESQGGGGGQQSQHLGDRGKRIKGLRGAGEVAQCVKVLVAKAGSY